MEKKIVLDYNIDKVDLKKLNANSFKEFNGIYFYNDYKHHKQGIVINVGSYEFTKLKNEDIIIDLFTKIDIHETVHHLIHEIRGVFDPLCKYEETIADIMAGK